MARPNVHTASRDELVEAGVRAELADEILKRRRKGKIDLETLDEVPGIGPATLEQLRKALDFRDPPKNGDDRDESNGKGAAEQTAQAGKRIVDQAAEVSARTRDQVAEVGKNAADQAVEAGKRTTMRVAEMGERAAEQTAEVTRELTDRTGEMVQQGLHVVQRAADAARELPRAVAGRSAEGAAEISRTLLSLVHDQTRQNWDLLQALTTAVAWDKVVEAVDWDRVFQIQSEFARGSLERSAQLTQRYLEVTQAVITATASATRLQARKAA